MSQTESTIKRLAQIEGLKRLRRLTRDQFRENCFTGIGGQTWNVEENMLETKVNCH